MQISRQKGGRAEEPIIQMYCICIGKNTLVVRDFLTTIFPCLDSCKAVVHSHNAVLSQFCPPSQIFVVPDKGIQGGSMKRVGPTMHLRTVNNAPTFSRKPFHSANRLWPINGSACDQYFIHKLGKLGKESGGLGERKYNGQKKPPIWLTSEKVANCRCFESSVPITEHLKPLLQQSTITTSAAFRSSIIFYELDRQLFFTGDCCNGTQSCLKQTNKYKQILDLVSSFGPDFWFVIGLID